jgi:hypothetical protein
MERRADTCLFRLDVGDKPLPPAQRQNIKENYHGRSNTTSKDLWASAFRE